MLAIPGEELGWTAVLRFLCGDPEQLARVAKIMQWKKNLPKEETLYLPPTTLKGKAQGAVLVSDGVVVEELERESGAEKNKEPCSLKETETNNSSHPIDTVNNSSHPRGNIKVSKSVMVESVSNQEVEETSVKDSGKALGITADGFSILEEAEGKPLGGRQGTEGTRETTQQSDSTDIQ